MKADSLNGLAFEPPLPEKETAVGKLEMGIATRITLEFRSRFWPRANFGFVHSDDPWLPTWWSDERALLLTGWAGGPRAEALAREPEDAILTEAVRALSRIFRVETARIQDLLVASYYHNWATDEFSLGAYSYTPVGGLDVPRCLAAPVGGTLFFAGEATDSTGEQGTVHGALASGKRAAAEILQSAESAQGGPRFRQPVPTNPIV